MGTTYSVINGHSIFLSLSSVNLGESKENVFHVLISCGHQINGIIVRVHMNNFAYACWVQFFFLSISLTYLELWTMYQIEMIELIYFGAYIYQNFIFIYIIYDVLKMHMHTKKFGNISLSAIVRCAMMYYDDWYLSNI